MTRYLYSVLINLWQRRKRLRKDINLKLYTPHTVSVHSNFGHLKSGSHASKLPKIGKTISLKVPKSKSVKVKI